jgi:hypothetical protein
MMVELADADDMKNIIATVDMVTPPIPGDLVWLGLDLEVFYVVKARCHRYAFAVEGAPHGTALPMLVSVEKSQ